MMRRSGRLRCTFFSSPSSRSVAVLRSCASSTITTLQLGVYVMVSDLWLEAEALAPGFRANLRRVNSGQQPQQPCLGLGAFTLHSITERQSHSARLLSSWQALVEHNALHFGLTGFPSPAHHLSSGGHPFQLVRPVNQNKQSQRSSHDPGCAVLLACIDDCQVSAWRKAWPGMPDLCHLPWPTLTWLFHGPARSDTRAPSFWNLSHEPWLMDQIKQGSYL